MGDDYFVFLKLAQDTLLDPAKRFAYDRFGPDILNWGSQERSMQDFLYTAVQKSLVPQYAGGFLTILFLNFTWWSDWGRYVSFVLSSVRAGTVANFAVALLHLCWSARPRVNPNHPASESLHPSVVHPGCSARSAAHFPRPLALLPPPLPDPHPGAPDVHHAAHLHLATHATRSHQESCSSHRRRPALDADDAATGAATAAVPGHGRRGHAAPADGICPVPGGQGGHGCTTEGNEGGPGVEQRASEPGGAGSCQRGCWAGPGEEHRLVAQIVLR